MMTTIVFLIVIVLVSKHEIRSIYAISPPRGLCFVPTKLSEAGGELSTALITPQSPGYQEAYNEFIDPILKAIADNTEIFEKGAKHRLKSKKDNIEVYYIDNYQDRMFHSIKYLSSVILLLNTISYL